MSLETLEQAASFANSSLALLRQLDLDKPPHPDSLLARAEHGFLEAARIIKAYRDREIYAWETGAGDAMNAASGVDFIMLDQPLEGVLMVKLETRRLDAAVADAFKFRMSQYLESGERKFVIDMGNIGFMDSRGLGALILCAKLAGRGNMALYNVSARVRSLFQLTRMDEVLTVRADRDAAVLSVQG